jgi:membrane-associated protein
MFGFDLIELIKAAGYIGLFGIVFAESGLLIGFFLPGDSLLFTAGFLASQNLLNIWALVPLMFIAAVLGDSVGYSFGVRVGPRIFKKEDSLLFNKEHLRRANNFFLKHGGKTIILARFMPVVRTFAPILAGVGTMKYRTFLFYNIIGGFLWAVGLTLLGYFLGRLIPNVDKYLLPIIALIILLSVAPSVIHVLRSKHDRKQIIVFVKRLLRIS